MVFDSLGSLVGADLLEQTVVPDFVQDAPINAKVQQSPVKQIVMNITD